MDNHPGTPLSVTVDSQGHLALPPNPAQDGALEPGDSLPLTTTPEGMLVRWPLSQLRKVYIEATSRCNLSCRTCMRNAWDEPIGHMATETFDRVLETLSGQRPPASVFFGGFGEPLMHPRIVEMVQRSARIASKVELITNGILLDADVSARLIEAGLSTLWVSLDGASPESYADVRLSNSLGGVLRNITAYRETHRRLKNNEPDIGVVFVAMKRNINDFPALVRQSTRLGVSRYMLTNILPYTAEMCGEVLYHHSVDRWDGQPSPWNPSVDMPEMDANATTRDVLFRIQKMQPAGSADHHDRCPFVEQRSTSIAWDGSVSPCLGLLHSHVSYLLNRQQSIRRYRLGNVNDRSLRGIWLSEEYTGFRQKVEQFDFAPCTICGGCEMAEGNQEDCFGNSFPVCGACLWARGVIQCP